MLSLVTTNLFGIFILAVSGVYSEHKNSTKTENQTVQAAKKLETHLNDTLKTSGKELLNITAEATVMPAYIRSGNRSLANVSSKVNILCVLSHVCPDENPPTHEVQPQLDQVLVAPGSTTNGATVNVNVNLIDKTPKEVGQVIIVNKCDKGCPDEGQGGRPLRPDGGGGSSGYLNIGGTDENTPLLRPIYDGKCYVLLHFPKVICPFPDSLAPPGNERPPPEGYPGDERPPPEGNPGDDRPPLEGYPGDELPPPEGYPGDERPPPEENPGDERPPPEGNPGVDHPAPEGYPGDERPPTEGYPGEERPPPEGYPGDERPPPEGYAGHEHPPPEGYPGDERPPPNGYPDGELPSCYDVGVMIYHLPCSYPYLPPGYRPPFGYPGGEGPPPGYMSTLPPIMNHWSTMCISCVTHRAGKYGTPNPTLVHSLPSSKYPGITYLPPDVVKNGRTTLSHPAVHSRYRPLPVQSRAQKYRRGRLAPAKRGYVVTYPAPPSSAVASRAVPGYVIPVVPSHKR